MPRSPRSLGLLVLAAAITLSACSSGPPPAATVGADRITDKQLAKDMSVFRFLAAINRQSCGQALPGETAQSACARFTLSSLIQEDLVKGYAKDHGLSVDETKVAGTLSQLRSSLGTGLDAQLSAQGLTQTDLTDIVRRILLFNEVEKAVGATSIKDAQLKQLYRQQIAQFTQIHAKHILVKTKAEALRIEKQVTPQNFGELAKKYSIDQGSAAKGGDLGTLAEASLDPDFVKGALALKAGQISPPVKTQFGWHVIELISVNVQPFGKVRDQLVGPLQAQVFSTWLRGRFAHVRISVNPKYGRFDTTNGDIVPIRSTSTTPPTPAATPAASATP